MPTRSSARLSIAVAIAAIWIACLTSSPAYADPPDLISYSAPLDGMTVVNPFDQPEQRWARGHRGVDLGATANTVLAPGDGTITFAGWIVDRPVVTITHPDGLRSSMEPVTDPPPVGTAVRRGDPVGSLGGGASHCAPELCLHWGVRRGEDYIDPMSLLSDRQPRAVILLPWDASEDVMPADVPG